MEQDSERLTVIKLIELLKKQLEIYPPCENGEVKIATEVVMNSNTMDVFAITDMVILHDGSLVLVNKKETKQECYSFNTVGKA